MRDLNRKLDKFVKEKAVSSAKLNRGLSPHVTYGVIASATTASTTTITKNISTGNTKKPNGRTYSMTVSFYNPKYEPGYPKDFTIRHEAVQQKNIRLGSPERLKSPKRDPILQNNNETAVDVKPLMKHFPNAGKTTMFTAEQKVSQRGQGNFNLVYNARSISPRREAIKTDIPHPKEHTPEKERRLRKKVKVPHTNNFDIIVDGDLNSLLHKGRRHVSPRAPVEAQKFNDKKYFLAAERGTSNRGIFFQESKVSLGAHPIEDNSTIKSPKGKRFASPQSKGADGMKSLVEYGFSLPYREEKLSPKCNHISFANLAVSANSSMIE